MQVMRASEFTVPDLTRLWNRGYADFFVPSAFTDRQMAGFIWGSDIDLTHSVVAVDDGRPAGFSLLGVRGRRGWIGGVGVAHEYRGCGLGSALFAAHMDVIRQELQLMSVQLEVLVQNWAHKLYERNGFATTRRLSFLEGRLPEGRLPEGRLPEGRAAAADGVAAAAGGVTAAADGVTADPDGVTAAADGVTAGAAGAPGALLADSERMHSAWPAVWQREPDDLRRCVPPIERALWAGPVAAPHGYLLYNQHGRQLWIADAAAGASVAVATRLVGALAQLYPGFTVAIGDEPEGSPCHRALLALGCHAAQARWEMHSPLS